MGMTGRILGRLLPVLLAAVLAGCSKEREIPSPDDGAVTVRLVLNMPSPRAGGTAEPDAEPEGNDYWLHPRDVQLLVYDTEGNFEDRVVMSLLTPVTGTFNRYTLSGTLTRLRKADVEGGKSYRIVVLCNLAGACPVAFPYGDIPATEEELYGGMTFEYPLENTLTHAIFDETDSGRIPMWGKKTAVLKDCSTITVDMLRAMAKVKVCLDRNALIQEDSDATYTLSSVVVKHCHMQGSMAPRYAGEQADTYEPAADEENVVGDFHGMAVPFHEHPAGSGEFYIYLPEQKKGGSEMEVTINNHVYPLKFGDYSTKKLFPVVRNYYYVFNIVKINTTNGLVYQVCKWQEMEAGEIVFD